MYFQAWRNYTFRGAQFVSALIPALNSTHDDARPLGLRPSRHHLQHDLDRLLSPTSEQGLGSRARIAEHYDRLVAGARSWWEGSDWVLSYQCGFPAAPVADDHRKKAITSFFFTGMTILGF